jgi:hypothetical protein
MASFSARILELEKAKWLSSYFRPRLTGFAITNDLFFRPVAGNGAEPDRQCLKTVAKFNLSGLDFRLFMFMRWLEIECSKCQIKRDVSVAELPHVDTTCIHDFAILCDAAHLVVPTPVSS